MVKQAWSYHAASYLIIEKEIVMRKILFSILSVFLLASCGKDSIAPEGSTGKVDVGFVVTLPEQETLGTRAATDTDIENIDLLIFNESGNFLERISIPGSDITGSGTQKNFTARLDISNVQRTIYVIANGRTSADVDRVNFSSITANMAQATAMSNLQTSILGAEMLPLVMWGRRQVPSITSSVTISNLQLLRSTAAVEVKVATGITQFTLTQFTLIGVKPSGKVAPSVYTTEAATPGATVTNPTTDANVDYHTLSTPYWAVATETLYAYDRASNTTDFPFLIVRGSYSGTDGYYKVKMVNGSGTPYSLVRNHKYIVTITDITGPGYANINDAIANGPMNIRVNIVDQRGDIAIMSVDDQHELGISNNTVIVQGSANTTRVLTIANVYSSRTVAPTVSFSGTGLTNVTLSAASGTDQIRTLTARCSGAGTGTITITSGTLKQTIAVTTRAFSAGMTSATNLYYAQLVGAANKPWQADVVGGAYVWLNKAGQASTYANTASWGYGHMRSNNFNEAVVYFHQTNTSVAGTVKYTYLNGTNQMITWMIMNK